MIKSISHKGLRQFAATGKGGKLPVQGAAQNRLVQMLQTLNAASQPEDMNLPGFHFHALTGDRKGTYSVRVTANWRLTFEWNSGATNVKLEDYH
ncbi:type II toxin-antitoxin system RelE/ParE family toxin [Nisaea acidiphila]|uniref:Type II toxin-antitoxin system RelE/ParE family toxin n=1 Tax=Nisaea acidiphila TaxID=1862145 RepID=A0A9J7B0E9_9PROT|nr:type II toxin-antitoxin system RelE/ParE family toxin [Nisaea acidiphila]UUX51165.1 type II toxin-antitoxin system RelE/ParE family toxin [Nisaea acidiphila]